MSDFLISLHFTSCHYEFPDKNLRGIDRLLRFFLHIANRGRLMRQEKLLTGQDICDLMLILSRSSVINILVINQSNATHLKPEVISPKISGKIKNINRVSTLLFISIFFPFFLVSLLFFLKNSRFCGTICWRRKLSFITPDRRTP